MTSKTIHKTYKFRLKPGDDQQRQFAQIAGVCRLVWNICLEQRVTLYSSRRKSLTSKNYFTLPRLLMNSDIGWSELGAGHLKAEFPPHIPTHSPTQHFYFDTISGLLLRHDYAAAVVATVMHAANVVLQPSQHEGIPFPAERRVAPTGFHNKALSWPVLIHIHVNEYALGAI